MPGTGRGRGVTAAELRAAVEARTGGLTEAQWADMSDLLPDDPAGLYSDTEIENIVELVEDRIEVWGTRPSPRVIEPRARDEANSSYGEALSWFAGNHTPPLGVKMFRKALLSDQLLEPNDALPWLARLVEEDLEGRDLPDQYSVPVSSPRPTVGEVSADTLEFLAPTDGLVYWVPVVPNTNSNWLRSISVNLENDLGWSRSEGALWVVTGIAPRMDAIRSAFRPSPRYNPFGERIELSINPSIAPRDVMKVYAEARVDVVGRRTRLQMPKHLNLAVFADQRPPGEPWAESMRRWNKRFPRWRYPSKPTSVTDVTQFARDAKAARDRFLAQRPLAKPSEEP